MEKKQKLSEKINSYAYNHLWLKYTLEYGKAFLLTALSALLFSFAFTAFLAPGEGYQTIVSGGISGLSLVLRLPFELSPAFADKRDLLNVSFSILYFVLNVPILIIARAKGLGKRFVFFTIVNVALTSLFTWVFNETGANVFIQQVAQDVNDKSGFIGRALFAGVFAGLSSAFAFYIESSAGGFDVLSYTISIKKGTSTGQYVLIIDIFVILIYNVSYACAGRFGWSGALVNLLFSVIYIVTITLIVDLINIRNKKARVEIITDKEDLPGKLLTHIPHGATVMNGTGVFSGKTRYVVNMVVSTNEVKKVVGFIKELDPESFVSVTSLQQVYGRFHMKPIK